MDVQRLQVDTPLDCKSTTDIINSIYNAGSNKDQFFNIESNYKYFLYLGGELGPIGKAGVDPLEVKAYGPWEMVWHRLIRGHHLTGNTSNNVGYAVTPVTVAELPGLNTFGISMARIDFAPTGINPPYTHPRATETLTVIEGTILVGFVTSNPENRLITKVLVKGDVFVFPEGLSHFQKNLGNGYALALGALSSQNPGVITIANDVFGSNPDIAADILAKAFQTDINVVYQIQSKF
ncbi:hypothetical protein R6Q59_015862 [Mikania micrantha]